MEINENHVRYNYIPDRKNSDFDHLWICDGSECAEICINQIPDLIKTLKKCYEAHKEYTLFAGFYKDKDEDVVHAICYNLRGCQTYGDNLEHAKEMIKDCFSGLLESYIDIGHSIPWHNPEGIPWCDDYDFDFICGEVYKIKL